MHDRIHSAHNRIAESISLVVIRAQPIACIACAGCRNKALRGDQLYERHLHRHFELVQRRVVGEGQPVGDVGDLLALVGPGLSGDVVRRGPARRERAAPGVPIGWVVGGLWLAIGNRNGTQQHDNKRDLPLHLGPFLAMTGVWREGCRIGGTPWFDSLFFLLRGELRPRGSSRPCRNQ